jgi:hypothetical protein
MDQGVTWELTGGISNFNSTNVTIQGSGNNSLITYNMDGTVLAAGEGLFNLSSGFVFMVSFCTVTNTSTVNDSQICSSACSKTFQDVTVNLPDAQYGFIGDSAGTVAGTVLLTNVTLNGTGGNCYHCVYIPAGSSADNTFTNVTITGMYFNDALEPDMTLLSETIIEGFHTSVAFYMGVGTRLTAINITGGLLYIRISATASASGSKISNSDIDVFDGAGLAISDDMYFSNCTFASASATPTVTTTSSYFSNCHFTGGVSTHDHCIYTGCVFEGTLSTSFSNNLKMTSCLFTTGFPVTFIGPATILSDCSFAATVNLGNRVSMSNCLVPASSATAINILGSNCWIDRCDVGTPGGVGTAAINNQTPANVNYISNCRTEGALTGFMGAWLNNNFTW